MKIRNGFVSNSSSSSFIVMFPRIPSDKYDVMRILEGSKNESMKYLKKFESYFDNYVPSFDQVANQVWIDIEKQSPNDLLRAVSLCSSDQYAFWYDDEKSKLNYTPFWKEDEEFDGYTSFSELKKDIEKNKQFEDNYDDNFDYQIKEFEEMIQEIEEFKEENEGILYSFTYSDDEGDFFSYMEQGEIFNKLPNVRYSKH